MDASKGHSLDSRYDTIRADGAERNVGRTTFSGQSPREQIPDTLVEGRYKLVKQIGTGGMGVVYLAMDQRLERNVAIKRLVVKSYNARTVQRRFLREAQTIAALGHYNIVNIFDIGQDQEGHYIVMEYVAGPVLSEKAKPSNPTMPLNLHQYVNAHGPMEPEMAITLMRRVCNALQYAHNQGIIHRDIKPTNILLNVDFEPKLVDFGLARPINLAKSEEITLAGSILGTPEYCAPEQWGDASAVDVRADIYAMAGVFWYAISGRSPRYFREHDLDKDLAEIIGKALAAKPDERYPTVGDFLLDLDKLDEEEEVVSRSAAIDPQPSVDVNTTQAFWVCRNCEQTSPDSAKYCIHCGASGLDNCPNCGTLYRVGLQHCPGCGVDVKLVEESATMLSTAKNHASFCEFETALNYLNETTRNASPEARQLYKEWREAILRRRNLLMELDSALRVYNIEKAIELAVELQKMVPEECLSESADFKVSSSFSSMLQELKQMLIEAANRAKQDFNLARFTETIRYLNQVFGDDVCHVVNQQLLHIEHDLDNSLTQAGLAAGMNCITHAQEVIDATAPWKGGELGNRRSRLSATCRELIEKREEAIEETEKAIREGRFSEALILVKQMAKFRLPPNNSEITPASGDRAAQDRIIKIDKALTATIEQSVGDWVKRNQWDNIVNSLGALKKSDSVAWRRLSEKLRTAGNHEIVKRYNSAIELEKKGRYHKAARAWEEFLMIPQQLTPSNLWQYAMEFPNRAKVHGRRQANTISRRVLAALAVFWAFFFWFQWREVLFPLSELTIAGAVRGLGLSSVLLVMSLVLVVLSRGKRFNRFESQMIAVGRSPRLTLLAFLIVSSPLVYLVHQIAGLLLGGLVQQYPFLHPLIVVTLVWIIIDLFNHDGLELPARFACTLGWSFGVIGFVVLQGTAIGADEHLLWPLVTFLHAIGFLVILLVHRLIHQHDDAPVLPAPPRREDDSDADVPDEAEPTIVEPG